jgi:hypothetical protein
MDITAKKIIELVNEKSPYQHQREIKNMSDLNLVARFRNTYQYIIGVDRADKEGGYVTYDSYKRKISETLKGTPLEFNCLGWSFKGHEKDEAIEILNELSAYYNADLEIDKMFNKLNIKHNEDDEYFYVIVTSITIPLFIVE